MAEASENNALAVARLPTRFGEFRIIAFPGETANREHIALVLGDIEGEVLVRLPLGLRCRLSVLAVELRVDCEAAQDHLPGPGEVRVGQSVSLDNARDKKVGVIVNASALAGVKTECLLSVSGFLEVENVYCYKDQCTEQITTLPLPYPHQ